MPRDILLALLIGTNVVLLLAVADNQGIDSRLTRILLWPGLRLAQATGHGHHDIGIVLVLVPDIVMYGFISYLVLRAMKNVRG